jgi:hypothetical protein
MYQIDEECNRKKDGYFKIELGVSVVGRKISYENNCTYPWHLSVQDHAPELRKRQT